MHFKHLRGQHDQRDHGRRKKFGGASGVIQSSSLQPDQSYTYNVEKSNILRGLLNGVDYNDAPFKDNPIAAAEYITYMRSTLKKPSKNNVESYEQSRYEAVTDIQKRLVSFAGRFSKAKTEAGRDKVLSDYRKYLQEQSEVPESKIEKKKRLAKELQRQLDLKRHPTKGTYIDGIYVASQRGSELARKFNPVNSVFSTNRKQQSLEAVQEVQDSMQALTEAWSKYRKSAKTPSDEKQLNQAKAKIKRAEDREAMIRSDPFLNIPDDAFPFQHGIEAIRFPNIKAGLLQTPDTEEQRNNLLTTINKAIAGLARIIPPNDRNGNPVTIFPQLRVMASQNDEAHYRFTPNSGAVIRMPETDVGTAAHELLHAIEDFHPELGKRVQGFFDYRTQRDQVININPTNSVYSDYFDAKLDEWGDPYAGRLYDNDVVGATRSGRASEVLSVVISSLQNFPNSIEALQTLEDEEHLGFFFDVLSDPDSWG